MVPTEASHSLSANNPVINKDILEQRVEKLKGLCQEVDPYVPLTEEQKNELASFGIISWRDPYHLTNQLVLILENAIEELILVEKEEESNKVQ